jgi:MoaD family protein
MEVNFYGTYRLITGTKLSEFEIIQGSTIRDLLQAVTTRYPVLRDEMFDEHDNLYSYIPLYINGRNPRLLEDGLKTPVKPKDVMSIFSPISSGRINVEAANQALKD